MSPHGTTETILLPGCRSAHGVKRKCRFSREWAANLLGCCADRANIGIRGAVCAKRGTVFGTPLVISRSHQQAKIRSAYFAA